MVTEKWGADQWQYFDYIVQRESNWIVSAKNPSSSARGLMQTLIGTERAYGCVERSEIPEEQIDCGITYITERYGDPYTAYQFWLENHWY